MSMDLPPAKDIAVVAAAAVAGVLGRYINFIRRAHDGSTSTWVWLYQLPVGLALGTTAGIFAHAYDGLDFWQTMLIANVAGIVGPEIIDVMITWLRKRYNLGNK